MSEKPEYHILIQVGWQRSKNARSPGTLVKAYLVFESGEEQEVTWGMVEGQWITNLLDRGSKQWFLAKVPLHDQDRVRLEVFTGYKGKGGDPKLTFKRLYVLDENSPVREFSVPLVGVRGFPLIKGRLLELSEVSQQDIKEESLQNLVVDEDGM